MAHWIIENQGFSGTLYQCSNCRSCWNDLYDDVRKLDVDNLFCPKCGEPLNEDETEYIDELNTYKMKTNKEICRCLETKSCDEYWGKWLECECGYTSNTASARYCGGCGKKIEVIGVVGNQSHFGEH
jgi:hypothetical protein